MAQENHHLTTEQFSVHLDGQLSDQEQSQMDAHLKACKQCQQELKDLRRTVALLHALPHPALPRSFVLPLDIQPSVVDQKEEAVEENKYAPIPLAKERAYRTKASEGNPAHRRWPGYVRTTLRTISAIAALIGLVLFLSGVLASLPRGGNVAMSTASSSAPANVPEVRSNATVGAKVEANNSKGAIVQISPSSQATIIPQTPSVGTGTSATGEQVAPTPTAGSRAEQTYTAAPTSSQLPTILFFDLSSGAGRLSFGFLLLLLGVMGFVVFKRRRRRDKDVRYG